MRGRESDWLGHISWRGEKEDKVSILESLDKEVKKFANLDSNSLIY